MKGIFRSFMLTRCEANCIRNRVRLNRDRYLMDKQIRVAFSTSHPINIHQIIVNRQSDQDRVLGDKDAQSNDDGTAGGSSDKQKNKKESSICSEYLAFKRCQDGADCKRRHLIGEEAVRRRYTMKAQICSHNSFCFSGSCRKLRRHVNYWKPSMDENDKSKEAESYVLPLTKERLWEISIIVKEEVAHLSSLSKSSTPPKVEVSYEMEAFKCVLAGAQRWLNLNEPVISLAKSEDSKPIEVLKPADVVLEFLTFFLQNVGVTLYKLAESDHEWINSLDSLNGKKSSNENGKLLIKDDLPVTLDPWKKFLKMNSISSNNANKAFLSKISSVIKATKLLHLNVSGLSIEELFKVLDQLLLYPTNTQFDGRLDIILYSGNSPNSQMIPELFIATLSYFLLNKITFVVGYDKNHSPLTFWLTLQFHNNRKNKSSRKIV